MSWRRLSGPSFCPSGGHRLHGMCAWLELVPLIPYHEYTFRPGSNNLELCWSPIAPSALVRVGGCRLVTEVAAMKSLDPDGHRSTPPSTGGDVAVELADGYSRYFCVT